MTQREIARQFRVSHPAIALWESGRRKVPGAVEKLIEIYEAEVGLSPRKTSIELRHLVDSWQPKKLAPASLAGAIVLSELKTALHLKIDQILYSGKNGNHIRLCKQIALARRFADAVIESRGLGLKIAQMMGVFEFVLDDPMREVLKAIVDQRRAMSPVTVAKIVYEDLGKSPRHLFAEWEETPVAVASVGQVHRARLRSGELVAVKVRYGTIEENLKSDTSTIARFSQLFKIILQDRFPADLIEEFQDHLLTEFNYENEASNQEIFREFFLDHPNIYIPAVYREFTAKRVLTTEYVQALSFEAFCQTASQAERNRAGESIWDFHALSKVHKFMFNTDSHSGNYLFRDGKVICLDFGCIKTFDPSRIEELKKFCEATLSDDDSQLIRVYHEIGFLKDTLCDGPALRAYHNVLSAPYLVQQPFQFTPEYFTNLSKIVPNPPPHLGLRTPKNEVMAARQFFGTWSLLCSLRAQSDWRQRMIDVVGL